MNRIETLIAAEVAGARHRLAERYEVVEFDGSDLAIRDKLVVIAKGFVKNENEGARDFEDVWPRDALDATLRAVGKMFPNSKRLYVRRPLDCNIQELDPSWPEQRAGIVASIRCVGDEVLT